MDGPSQKQVNTGRNDQEVLDLIDGALALGSEFMLAPVVIKALDAMTGSKSLIVRLDKEGNGGTLFANMPMDEAIDVLLEVLTQSIVKDPSAVLAAFKKIVASAEPAKEKE